MWHTLTHGDHESKDDGWSESGWCSWKRLVKRFTQSGLLVESANQEPPHKTISINISVLKSLLILYNIQMFWGT